MSADRQPIPIAVRLGDGVTLRGHEWSMDGPAVLFVHDVGDDLDSWGSVTAQMSAQGFRVISVELRGHGMSEGEPEEGSLLDDLLMLLAEVTGSFGPVAVVAYGTVAETLLFVDPVAGAPVQVMISPLPAQPGGPDWRGSRPAMRLILNGTGHEDGHAFLNEIYPKMLGQKLRISGASSMVGPPLLADQPQLFHHMVMFVRRNLTAYHLAWIAEHADQIATVAEGQSDDPPATEAE